MESGSKTSTMENKNGNKSAKVYVNVLAPHRISIEHSKTVLIELQCLCRKLLFIFLLPFYMHEVRLFNLLSIDFPY